MSAPVQVQIEVCGEPEILVSQDLAQVSVLLHTTDPDSTLHAEITLYLRPADGVFWFEPSWLM